MKAANEHTIVRTDDPEWTGDTDGASCLVVGLNPVHRDCLFSTFD